MSESHAVCRPRTSRASGCGRACTARPPRPPPRSPTCSRRSTWDYHRRTIMRRGENGIDAGELRGKMRRGGHCEDNGGDEHSGISVHHRHPARGRGCRKASGRKSPKVGRGRGSCRHITYGRQAGRERLTSCACGTRRTHSSWGTACSAGSTCRVERPTGWLREGPFSYWLLLPPPPHPWPALTPHAAYHLPFPPPRGTYGHPSPVLTI